MKDQGEGLEVMGQEEGGRVDVLVATGGRRDISMFILHHDGGKQPTMLEVVCAIAR